MAVFHKEFYFHLFFWTAYITVEVGTVLIGTGQLDSFIDYAGHYCINIAFFYSTCLLVFPYAAKKRKVIPATFAILGNYAVFLTLKALLITLLKKLDLVYYNPYTSPYKFIVLGLWRGMFFFGMGAVYWFLKRYVTNIKETHALKIAAVEKEKLLLELELSKIQFQVNPHFIFNTLNFLYSKTHQKSSEAGEAILLWADILEYSFKEPGNDRKVLLKDELKQIQLLSSFVALVNSPPSTLTLTIIGDPANLRIPPMLLVTFVENLIKHGVLSSTTAPPSISIKINEEAIRFRTSNQKKSRQSTHGFHSGLNGATRRLEAFFPEKFKLVIHDHEEHFILELYIQL